MNILNIWKVAGLTAVLLVGPIAIVPPVSAMEDKIVAVVNDNIITLKDLKDYINKQILQLRLDGYTPEQVSTFMADLEMNGLRRLVEEKLILDAADDIGMEVKPPMIDERLQNIKDKYSSDQAFLDALVEQGATVSDLKKKITEQIKIKYMVDMEVRSKIYINPKDVTDYYKGHIKEFLMPERANVESIFVKASTREQEAVSQKVSAIEQALHDGRDFTEVAAEYSEMPSLGVVKRGTLLPSVESKIFSLQLDEHSGPVTTDNGVYFFKMRGRGAADIAPLEDVKKTIETQLFEEQFQQKLETWLDGLKKKAFIEVKE